MMIMLVYLSCSTCMVIGNYFKMASFLMSHTAFHDVFILKKFVLFDHKVVVFSVS